MKKKKNEMLEKIHKKRLEMNQEIGYLFRPLAICPLPAQTLGKRLVGKDKNEEYEILWTRKSGKFKVEILAHPKYGVPFGQDILIILFLAIEARKQKSRKIVVNFYRDFMKMFQMNPNDGRKYRLVKNSVFRIKNSMYSWEDESKKEREKGVNFLYIEEYDLNFDPKNPEQMPLFEQYILLSERFWYEINKHPIPFNLDAIRYLKSKPAYLNFYIWITTRVGMMYKNLQESKNDVNKMYIPYWGEYGLVEQLSTIITRRPNFRNQIKKWLKETKEIYPKCPVFIEGDGLKIELKSSNQLDIQPDLKQEIGKQIRKSIEERKKKEKTCPDCGDQLTRKSGKELSDGRKLDDYYRCGKCKKNLYLKDYPKLFE